MRNRQLIFNIMILALANAGTTLVYFSQMYLLYDFFDPETVYIATISVAYIAQGIGLFAFILLFKNMPSRFGHRGVLSLLLILLIPVALLTVQLSSGVLLMSLLIITNLIIGFILAFCFTNIAAFVPTDHIGLCWGASYAIGNILSWLVSQISQEIITSFMILPVLCIVIGFNIIPVILGENLPAEPMNLMRSELRTNKTLLWTTFIIVLMSIIYTIGSTDYSMIADTMSTSSTFYTRCFYAAGLLLAGYIYDKSHNLGAVLALASIVYPILAYTLILEEIHINLVYSFSFFALAFFAVYRTCTFISQGSENHNHLFLVSVGLVISRFVEGLIALVNVQLTAAGNLGFLIIGFLFIPLIIGFCIMILSQNSKGSTMTDDEKITRISEDYNLTRREIEVLVLIIRGCTNDEISSELTISNATARFHVSNVLKKTDCKNRVDVINKFQKMH